MIDQENKKPTFVSNMVKAHFPKLITGTVFLIGFVFSIFFVPRSVHEQTQNELDGFKEAYKLHVQADTLEKVIHDNELNTLKRRFATFKSETEMYVQNERVRFNLLENDVIRLQEQNKK